MNRSLLIAVLLCSIFAAAAAQNVSLSFLGQEPFTSHVSSAATINQLVYKVFAIGNGNLSYSIDGPDLFVIDSASGVITNTAPYPASPTLYSIVVHASNGEEVISANLSINVQPSYLKAPLFEHNAYTAYITENGPMDMAVVLVQAFSLTATSTMTYTIVNGNTNGAFHLIDSAIYTSGSLDREVQAQYVLTIRYIDNTGSADTQVQVNVLDLNDNAPLFTLTLYQFIVNETAFVDAVVGTVTATDSDHDVNAVFAYSLSGADGDKFSISNGGVVTSNIGLDYEATYQYTMVVSATDQGTPPLSSSSVVMVTVNNNNDECPVFSASFYILDVPLDPLHPPQVGVILSITAMDPDNAGPVSYAILSGNEAGAFGINSATGNLSLLRSDDIRGEYELTVSASDDHCFNTSLTQVEIGIGSANQHSPVFAASSCTAQLHENPPLGTTVTILLAADEDIGSNGQVKYHIVSNIGDYELFSVDPVTGNVTTTEAPTSYDREKQGFFQIGITATDGGFRQDFCILVITLLDINDNSPVFALPSYTINLGSSVTQGDYIILAQAQDLDLGSNGKVMYSLSTPPGCPFIIDATIGTISANETTIVVEGTCSLVVTATDQGDPALSSASFVNISLNSDGTLPVFNQSTYEVTIREDRETADVFLTVNATSEGQTVVYTIPQGSDYRTNSEGNFRIFPGGGIYIDSSSPVDYEQLYPGPYSFRLLVTATSSSKVAIAMVTVNVTDVNDNFPIFPNSDVDSQTPPTVVFSIVEHHPPGPIGIVQAFDADTGDNGIIIYQIQEVNNQFHVSSNGTVSSLVQEFDAEAEVTNFEFFISAFNPGLEDKNGLVIVRVVIEDINDNPPTFAMSQYTLSLNETYLVHSKVTTLVADEPDRNDRNNLVFTILSGNNDAMFELVSSAGSGSLYLRRQLDYETTTQYILNVEVTDGLYTDAAVVTINVLDVDDEAPVFEHLQYTVTIVENTAVDTELLTVLATDVDSDTIVYSLSGLAMERFSIDANGVIKVIGTVDREEFLPSAQIVFLVFASGGSLTTADVIVNITDLNDNAPQFINSPFYGSVPENTAPGANGLYVATIIAIDQDEGDNGTITYTLVAGEDQGFAINLNTGVIIANRIFDREVRKIYTLVVRATDMGKPVPLSSEVNVIVEIGDYNDNPPYWPYPYMFARVFENAPLGTVVIELPVGDPDNGINSSVTFNLTGGNELNKFSLNSATGEVLVAGTLDYETENERQHFMYFSIRDNGSPSYSSNVIGELEIHVLDGNDHMPYFDDLSQTIEVSEDVPVGHLVITVAATDTDTGSNSLLTYSTDREDLFTVIQDNVTAMVHTKVPLDHEQQGFIILAITVSDNGYPSLSSVLTLNILLTDVNDEAPVFSQSVYTASVIEHTSPPLTVLNTEATDSDQILEGGAVAEYRIHTSNDASNRFDYTADGTLSTNQELDREQQSQYVFTVIAVDNDPVNPLTGTATIIIDVTDINDNPSQTGGSMQITVRSVGEVFPAQELATIYFDDPDDQDQFTDCSLTSGDDTLFAVSTDSCTLSSLLDTIPASTYELTVRGHDGVHDYVSTTVTITYEEIPVPLQSSLVTMTMNSSAASYFENIHFNLVNQLSTLLSLSPSQVIIYSVQNGHHDQQNTVDVTLAILNQQGEYVEHQSLIHQLYLTRASILFGTVVVFSLPVDACVGEPCDNLGECRTMITIHSSYSNITSQQHVLFTPLITIGYSCECASGTSGNLCEVNYNDCYSSPCQYDATCSDGINGFTCDCPTGTFGTNCSINPDECTADTCSNGATCINGFGAYYCDCASLFYGNTCQYSFFQVSDLCVPNPCNNGGTCSAGRDSFTCLCVTGFTGLTCNDAVEYQGGCVGNPCYNGSVCTETEGGFVCTCSVGFTGPQCRFPLDNCELGLCRNGATCETGHYGSYHCVCPSGYSGEHCTEVLSPCEPNPCYNSGTCQPSSDITYTCECSKYFYGNNCQYAVQPQDYCTDGVCNFGNCTSGQMLYTCSCLDGYEGIDCTDSAMPDSSVCASNPCRYGGICISNNNTYLCECPIGFTGQDCQDDINECEASPCTNGGQCIDGFGSYLCTCPEGYGGRTCEVSCPPGFAGERCEIDLNYCLPDTCSNGGTCMEERDGYSCVCPPQYKGSQCTVINNCTTNTCLYSGECVDSSETGFMCVCPARHNGPLCELNTVSFLGDTSTASYRAYNTLPFRSQGTISFRFATQSANGLLLLAMQHQEGQSVDHIAVEIINSAIVIKFSQGDSSNNVTILSSIVNINDGQWHQLDITVTGKEVSALLDYCIELQSSPLLLGLLDCTASSTSLGQLSAIDTGLPLWLGGAPSLPEYLSLSSWGITACISDVYISNVLVDLEDFIDEYRAQAGCPQIEDSCNDVDCGQGTCIPMWNGYRCNCDTGIAGANCDQVADIVTFDGLTYAQYTVHAANGNIVKRQTVAASSSFSEQLSLRLRTAHDNGVVYLVGDVTGEHHLIKLDSGQLLYSINLGSATETYSQSSQLADGEWHFLSVARVGLSLNITVDDASTQYTLSGQQITLEYNNNDIYIAGRPGSNGGIREGYQGCIQDVRLQQLALPTTDSNGVANVVYVGGGPDQGCNLGPCFPNPCNGGNCSEDSTGGYQCECPDGTTQTTPCNTQTKLSLTVIIAISASLGVLVVILVIASIIGCVVTISRRGGKYKITLEPDIGQFEIHENASTGNYHTQDCEEDTPLDNPDNVVRNRKSSVKSESPRQSKPNGGEPPSPPLPRASTPDIDAFIEEKVSKANNERVDCDSLRKFADEGTGNSMCSLSSISSFDDGEPCSLERVRLIGPEFEKIADLLEPVYADYDSEDTSSENSPQL